jgi:hypothetical protein
MGLIKSGAQSVVSNIGAAGAAGEALGQEIVGGFQSGFNSAFGAGAALSQTILGGFLSPLGESGQAITKAAGAITNAVGDVFNAFFTGAKALAGIGGKIAGIGAGVLLTGIGAALGLIAGPIGGMIGTVVGAGLAGLVGKALGAFGQMFGSLVSAAGEAIGKIGGLLGELGSSLFSLLSDVAKTVGDVGSAVLRLESAGFSSDGAGKLVQTMGFFGQAPGKVAEQFSKPYAAQSMGARAGSMGLPNPAEDIEGFLLKGAQQAEKAKRGGARSAQLFQTRLESAGFGDYANTFAMGPERVQKTLAVSRSFQVSGASLGELGGDVTMANNILSGLGTQIKLVFAETLMPLLPLISSGFAFIVQNKDAIVGAIQSAGQWIVNELPPMILRGAAGMLDAVSGLLGGFSAFAAGLAENLDFLLSAADSFLNGLRSFAAVMVGIATAISQGVANLFPSLMPKTPGGGASGGAGGGPGGNPGGNTSQAAGGQTGSGNQPAAAPSGSGRSFGGWKARAGGALIGLGTGAALHAYNPVAAITGGLKGAYKGWNMVNDFQTNIGDPLVYGTTPGAGASAGAGAAPSGTSNSASGNSGAGKSSGVPAQFAPVQGRGIVDAFHAGQTGFLDTFGPSNLAGNSKLKERLSGFLKGASASSANGSVVAGEWANDLRKKADDWGHPAVLKALDKIATAVDKNGDKVAGAVGESASGDVFSSLERRLGRNAFLAATR